MRISDWSSDVCSSDLRIRHDRGLGIFGERQLVLGTFAHQLEQLLAERVVDFLKHLARVTRCLGERLAHADRLAALTRKDERSEEHMSELQSLMRISYDVFCLKKKKITQKKHIYLES